jgi:hypothetical protein
VTPDVLQSVRNSFAFGTLLRTVTHGIEPESATANANQVEFSIHLPEREQDEVKEGVELPEFDDALLAKMFANLAAHGMTPQDLAGSLELKDTPEMGLFPDNVLAADVRTKSSGRCPEPSCSSVVLTSESAGFPHWASAWAIGRCPPILRTSFSR